VTGYNVYYGVASRVYTNKVTLGNVTNATIAGLQEGVTYYFAATAFNAVGLESDFSEEVSYTVPIPIMDNQPPTLNALNNISINQNAATQSVPLSGITSGSSGENQTLTVTATSSNAGLIPNPSVSYVSPNTTGTLTFTPVSGASGSATITVTVNDGQASNNIVTRTFVVNVNGKPTISAIPNQSIAINANTGPLPFVISDAQTPAGNLVVTATSSAPSLLPVGNIIFGGTGGNRTVTLTPVPGQTGSATVTLTVSDGTLSAGTTFQLQVLGIPDAPSILTIITNGDGTVSTSTKVEKMKTGKAYAAIATPAKGQKFTGWSGSVNSSSRKIQFVMESNIVLQANFIPNPFAPISGSYNGLFYESGAMRQESSGFFTIRVTKNGAYSGRLQIGSTRYPFSGKLGFDCNATNTISKHGVVLLTLKFQFGNGDTADQVQGELTDGTWISEMRGNRAIFNRFNPALLAGKYTLVIPGNNGDNSVPGGDGYGAVKVSSSGKIHLSGALADGTKFSESASLSKDGLWPLYVSLYKGSGSLASWIAFTNRANDDLNGAINWIKPPGTGALYADGFATESDAMGSAYTPPPPTNTLSHAAIEFSGGNLISDFSNDLFVSYNNKAFNTSTNSLKLVFSKNGLFSGKVLEPGSGKKFKFAGAVLQKAGNVGYGALIGTNLSSRVIFQP
jgi:hypothetical protein